MSITNDNCRWKFAIDFTVIYPKVKKLARTVELFVV